MDLVGALIPQPGGFEGITAVSESANGALKGQVVLPPKEAPLAQPNAVVEVTLQLHTALAPLGPDDRVNEDAIIANGGKPLGRELVAVPRIPVFGQETGDLLDAVTRPCLGNFRTG